jgi:hypothetical protein
VIDTKEDKANDIFEGLAKELGSLPETKDIVGAEGFLSLAWVWKSISVDLSLLKSSSMVRVSYPEDSMIVVTFTSHTF